MLVRSYCRRIRRVRWSQEADRVGAEGGVLQQLTDELEVTVFERVSHAVDLLFDAAMRAERADFSFELFGAHTYEVKSLRTSGATSLAICSTSSGVHTAVGMCG